MGISLPGLASGLNTELMIEGLMKLEKLPYQNLEAQKKDITNQQSVLRMFNTKLSALKTTLSDLTLSASFNITSGVSSNKGVVDITSTDTVAKGVYEIDVISVAKNHVMKSKGIDINGTELKNLASTNDKKLSLKINNETIAVTLTGSTEEEVLDNIAKAINESSGASASVILNKEGQKTLSISSKNVGEANKIIIDTAGSDSGVISALGLVETSAATDAVFKVNGIEITRSSNEISDVIQGATLNISSKGLSTITVKQDNDKIASKIEAFVNAYNEVATLINDSTGKGKVLQSNSTIRNIDQELRSMINGLDSTGVSGFKMLSELGIEIDKGITKPKDMTGKITFDKEKLISKLNQNSQAVMDLFNAEKKDIDGKVTFAGLAMSMNKKVDEWTNSSTGLLTSAITGFGSNITLLDERMESLSSRLEKKEEALRKQFAAMEVALTGLKNQQNWLAGQFASLTKSNSGS